jgi:hypothetical protein
MSLAVAIGEGMTRNVYADTTLRNHRALHAAVYCRLIQV